MHTIIMPNKLANTKNIFCVVVNLSEYLNNFNPTTNGRKIAIKLKFDNKGVFEGTLKTIFVDIAGFYES